MKPLISVIVPVYKVEPYLRKCVDSILNQTYTNLEIILVDDGSPDNCGVICDEYARKDPRVRVIHKENGGLSDARNVGMAVASGAYLSFVDSDDILPEGAIDTLHRIAEGKKADLVIGGHVRFTEEPCNDRVSDAATVRCLSREDAIKDFLCNGCASWARLYRREIHEHILFPVGEINEDEAIVLRILDACCCIAMTDEVVYYYRCRPESITTVDFNEKKLAWFRHCRDNHGWIREHYPELLPHSYDRFGDSIVFSLTEMAVSGYRNPEAEMEMRRLYRREYGLFRKYRMAGYAEKVRMILLRWLPYSVYASVMRIKRRG